MALTPRWLAKYLASNQDAAEAVYNATLDKLDALVGLNVIDRTLTAPPGGSEGDCYIVGASATGDWAGQDGNIAYFYHGQWEFLIPVEGTVAWLSTEGVSARYIGVAPTGVWDSKTGECVFLARKTTNQTYTTAVGINWETEDRKDAIYTHSASSHQITLAEVGWYQVECEVAIEQTGTAAYNFTEINGVLAGAAITGAVSRTTTHFGNQNIMTMSLNFTVNNPTAAQALEIQVVRHTGAAALRVLANYGRLKITRI